MGLAAWATQQHAHARPTTQPPKSAHNGAGNQGPAQSRDTRALLRRFSSRLHSSLLGQSWRRQQQAAQRQRRRRGRLSSLLPRCLRPLLLRALLREAPALEGRPG